MNWNENRRGVQNEMFATVGQKLIFFYSKCGGKIECNCGGKCETWKFIVSFVILKLSLWNILEIGFFVNWLIR